MDDVAIQVEGLGKRYRIGGKQERYRTLRDTLADAVTAPFRRAGKLLRGQASGAAGLDEIIWALKDVSFEVKRGEVVGIIGANGAGKSTLLKILSRITEPTEGYVDLYGRVGSLLEVGTGFHPELTGRENIYLNGTILGMSRREIDRKFDEIVDFSGVERFIDTPVKHYSSGMTVRLAFAVAAHLEPEILLVDEVLAVGDAEFQRKSLGKMGAVASEGRTVLFVSHNMSAIQHLCELVFWLDEGRVRKQGDPTQIIQEYIGNRFVYDSDDLWRHSGRIAGKVPLMREIRLCNGVDKRISTFKTRGSFGFEVECEIAGQFPGNLVLGFTVLDGLGNTVFAANSSQYSQIVKHVKRDYLFRVFIDELPLTPGMYGVSLFLGDGKTDLDVVQNAIHFDVVWDETLEDLAFPSRPSWGPVLVPIRWEID